VSNVKEKIIMFAFISFSSVRNLKFWDTCVLSLVQLIFKPSVPWLFSFKYLSTLWKSCKFSQVIYFVLNHSEPQLYIPISSKPERKLKEIHVSPILRKLRRSRTSQGKEMNLQGEWKEKKGKRIYKVKCFLCVADFETTWKRKKQREKQSCKIHKQQRFLLMYDQLTKKKKN